MADNIGQKVAKIGEKNKSNNVVNRDGLRLGDSDKSAVHPTTLSTPTSVVSGGPQRKKTPAFQITSVTVVNTRPSTDGGDDSADDLDESHTDDTSDVVDVSRITDIENETPSFSEDTFSKEDVFFNAATASLGSAPVIPTSAQYGLAILASEGGSQPVNTSTVPTNTNSEPTVATETGNVNNNVVNCVNKQDAEMRDVHTSGCRNERFKVVKIESTVPFKRGRWTCMDYLDHSTLQQQSQQAIINVTKNLDSESNVNSLKYCGTDSGVVLTDSLASNVENAAVNENVRSYAVQEHQQSYGSQVNSQNLSAAQSVCVTSVSPGQTLQQACPPTGQQLLQGQNPHLPHIQGQMVNPQQNLPVHHPQSLSQVQLPQQNLVANANQAQQHQSLPPHQFQQVIANANLSQQQAQSMVTQQSYVGQQPASPGMPGVMVAQQTNYYVPPASGVVTSVPLQTTGVSTLAQGQAQLPIPTLPVSNPVQSGAPTVIPVSHSQVPSVVTVVSQAQAVHHTPSVAHVSTQQQMEQKIQHVPVQQIPIQQPQIAMQQQPVLQQHQIQHPNPQIHLQQGASTQSQLQPPVSTQHLNQTPVLTSQHSMSNTQQHVQTMQHSVSPSSVPLGNIIQSATMMAVPNTMMAQTPLGQMQTVVMQSTSSAPAFIPQSPQISVSQPNLVPSSVPLATVYQTSSLVGTGTLPSAQWSNTAQAASLGPGTVGTAESTVTAGPTKEMPQSEGGGVLKAEPSDISKNTEEAPVTVPNVVEDTER